MTHQVFSAVAEESVETEFPAIVFNDSLTSNETPSCEPTVSSLNNNEIDFRISFDKSDDEDYTVVFDKNSFSYKIISTNDLKTDSEIDNEKVNKPLFPSPEPSVSCIYDLDFFKSFENEFLAIVYNDALTSKSDFSTEPTLCPQHIDKLDLKDETILSKYDEVEQSVLYLNDLFTFNVVYLNDLKSDKGNDDNEIDMIQSLGVNENTNKLLKESHDKIRKVFIMGSFIMDLNVNIVAWNHFVKGVLFNLIKNLYVPFGILFDPKWYYNDRDCARILQSLRYVFFTLLNLGKIGLQEWIRHMAPLPPHDQRHLWLRYQVVGYTKEIVHDFEQRLETIFGRQVNRVHILEFKGLTPDMRHDLAKSMRMVYTRDDGQEGVRVIHDKDDHSDYLVEISPGREFLRGAPLYTYIRDPVRRLCHRLISYNISRRGQAPEKVTVTDQFYLRSMDRGATNVPYLLAQYLFRHAEGRKSGARLSRGNFIGRLAHHFGLVSDDGLRGLSVVARELPLIDMGELVKLNICMEIRYDWAWVAPGLERKQVVAAGAPKVTKDAPAVDEGAQPDPAPVQTPQLPPPPQAVGRTMPRRLRTLVEEI
ncbi:hypothetical protein Tco_1295368 [Tanacetum coccineum]